MRIPFRSSRDVSLGLLAAVLLAAPACAAGSVPTGPEVSPWWVCPLILFAVTFVIGVLAVLSGVGGGVLYVPMVSSFFPIHLDFVRAAGLFVALSAALSAGPGLLRANLASLRLALPIGLITSLCAILGAVIGLSLPTRIVQIGLGATILGICGVMLAARKSEFPLVPRADKLSHALAESTAFTGNKAAVALWTGKSTAPCRERACLS